MTSRQRVNRAAIYLIGLAVALGGCGGGNSGSTPSSPTTTGSSNLPNISTFLANPSTTFVMDSAGLAQLTAARPFMGSLSGCSNNNLTLKVAAKDTAYTIDMYAPASGVVQRVDTCLNAGSFDRYGVSMDIAIYNGSNTTFSISGEPAPSFNGQGDTTIEQAHPCSGNVSGQDNGFFKQFIFVNQGQQVTAGQRVMQLYVYPLSYYSPNTRKIAGVTNATSDVLLQKGPFTNGGPACPNIFSPSIEAQLASKYPAAQALGFTCNGAPYPAGPICNAAGPGENIVGR